MHGRDRRSREGERNTEGGEATEMVPSGYPIPMSQEGEPPVGRRIPDGGEHQAERVGERRRQGEPQGAVASNVGEGAEDADGGEASELARKPPDSAQVLDGRGHDVDA